MELDSLLPPGGGLVSGGLKKVSYTHDGMIDLIITNPAIDQNAIAAHFGYTASWVSQIITSDTFQMRLAERKDELVDPTIRATLEDNFKAMIVRSMDILREKMNKPSHQIPDNLALRTLELSTRALGYGVRPEAVAPPSEGRLEELGERLVGLLERKRAEHPPLDAEVVEVK